VGGGNVTDADVPTAVCINTTLTKTFSNLCHL
jgi:hypothetical protein